MTEERKEMLAAGIAYSIFGLSYLFSKMALGVAEPLILLCVRHCHHGRRMGRKLLCGKDRKQISLPLRSGFGSSFLSDFGRKGLTLSLGKRLYWN